MATAPTDNSGIKFDTSLDTIFSTLHGGSLKNAVSNNLYGINHRQSRPLIPHNRDNHGLTFFTRPQLNMLSDNIRNLRKMYSLMTTNPLSIQRYVRCMLDPRLNNGFDLAGRIIPALPCPLVDPLQAFIPVLTNNLESCSGWPDIAVPTYTSTPGIYKEAYTQVAGIIENYEAWDLDCTFSNKRGDMVAYMMYIWEYYSSAVFQGTLVPYPDMIVENEIDYMTRVWRLTLDQYRKRVTKIACTGVAFPVTNPTGAFFDYQRDKPFDNQNMDISIRFRALGFQVFDPILLEEFNTTVGIFNPSMLDGNREDEMVIIPDEYISYFNNRGYPRIDPSTDILEWWMPYKEFQIRRDTVDALMKEKAATPDSPAPSVGL
jgi:hypothetical protein